MTDLTSPTSFDNPEPTSLVALFQQKHDKIASRTLPLQIPHWDNPTVTAVFRPNEQKASGKILKKVEKEKVSTSEQSLLLAEDSLIEHCVGLFYTDDQGQECSFGSDKDGPRTRFDVTTAESVGCKDTRARRILRFFYINDGDVLSAYASFMEWSGYADQQNHEDYLGE